MTESTECEFKKFLPRIYWCLYGPGILLGSRNTTMSKWGMSPLHEANSLEEKPVHVYIMECETLMFP